MTGHLILTVDYEVFGNGQGCLQHCMVEPADRILRVADRFNAPVTLFAEVIELIAMERECGRSFTCSVREQLRHAVSAGHDVQLHVHPQWTNAKRRPDGNWMVDFDRWRIGGLSTSETDALISSGKTWLDEVAYSFVPGRQSIAFRAGGWCVQPSDQVIRSLAKHGFRVESTVVPGMRRRGEREWSDFRSAPELPFWRVDSDVCRASASGLWEVPIASAKTSRLNQLATELRNRISGKPSFAPNCQGSYSVGPRQPLSRIATNVLKFLDLGIAKLDFSTMSAQSLVSTTADWMRRFGHLNPATPIVAIAHTKNWTDASSRNLADYLAWARDARIRFSTYPTWLDSLEAELSHRPRSLSVNQLDSDISLGA